MKTERIAPAIGQVWRDNDPRSPERYLRIAGIEGDRAQCVLVSPGAGTCRWVPVNLRLRSILLKRFRPTMTGYRFIEDGEAK